MKDDELPTSKLFAERLRARKCSAAMLAAIELHEPDNAAQDPVLADPRFWEPRGEGFDQQAEIRKGNYPLIEAYARAKWIEAHEAEVFTSRRVGWLCMRLSELTMDLLVPEKLTKRLHSASGKRGKGKPRPGRRSPVRDALRLLVAEGLDNAAILRELGDADAIASRARHGFPIEVCDPETTLADDDVLRWYLPGGDYENPETYPLATLIKALSAIRNSA